MSSKRPNWFSQAEYFIASTIFTAMLTGCVTMTGGSLKAYDDVTDPCNTLRQPLIATQTDMQKSVVTGVALGAIAGGGLAAILGGDSRQIVAGAGLGALSGGAAAYLTAKQKEARNREELIAAINNDAGADHQLLYAFKRNIGRLGSCRTRQIEQVRNQIKSGEISRSQGLAKANEIQTSIDEDNQIIEQVIGKADERYSTYVDAKAEVMGVEPERVAKRSPRRDPVRTLGNDVQAAKVAQKSSNAQTDRELAALKRLVS
jgi:hypothetical protein